VLLCCCIVVSEKGESMKNDDIGIRLLMRKVRKLIKEREMVEKILYENVTDERVGGVGEWYYWEELKILTEVSKRLNEIKKRWEEDLIEVHCGYCKEVEWNGVKIVKKCVWCEEKDKLDKIVKEVDEFRDKYSSWMG